MNLFLNVYDTYTYRDFLDISLAYYPRQRKEVMYSKKYYCINKISCDMSKIGNYKSINKKKKVDITSRKI